MEDFHSKSFLETCPLKSMCS